MRVYYQLIRAQLENSASDLSPLATGLIYFNTVTSVIKISNGSTWNTVADLGTSQSFDNKIINSSCTLSSPICDTLTTSGGHTISFPDIDGTVVTLTGSQNLTNKNLQASYFQGGTASVSNRIKLPSDTAAHLATLSASLSAGDIMYDITNSAVVYRDGSGIVTLSSTNNAGGTYLPVAVTGTNVTSVTPNSNTMYMRVGNIVTVSGTVDATTTAAGSTASDFTLSLPIASAIGSSTNAGGSASGGGATGETARMLGISGLNTMEFDWKSATAGPRTFSFTFTYRII